MDYNRIYKNLCELCNNTTPMERIFNRNKTDIRLNMERIYTEVHHIIPKHDGGNNEKENLVRLLPEEHLLAHFLLFKANKTRKDFLAVRRMISGMHNKPLINQEYSYLTNHASFLGLYALYRQIASEFRHKTGWQSDEGKKRISASRKNTFPCVDAETGESVGSVSSNHPNVLSGKWVHHGKGKVACIDLMTNERVFIPTEIYRSNKERYSTHLPPSFGENNNNYKEMTIERKNRVFGLVQQSIVDDTNFSVKIFKKKLKEEFKNDFKRISIVWICNNFGSIDNLVREYNSKNNTEYKYDPYYRSREMKKNSGIKTGQFRWVTNGNENIRLKESEVDSFLEKNTTYYRGRTKK